MVRPIFILCMALVFALAACTRVDQTERARHDAYFRGFVVVRVCTAALGWGQYVQRAPDGRLFVTGAAKPERWDDVKLVAPGLKPEDVC